MSGSTSPRRANGSASTGIARLVVCASLSVVVAACSTSPYVGVSEQADPPLVSEATTTTVAVLGTVLERPSTTAAPTSSTAAPTTTRAATSTSIALVPSSTSTLVPPTTVAPTLAPKTTTPTATPGWHQEIVEAAQLRLSIPDTWQVRDLTSVGSAQAANTARVLLPELAPALDAVRAFDGTRFVATLTPPDVANTPSVVVLEIPRATGATPSSVLQSMRALMGPRIASSAPAIEDGKLGPGAFVTYQFDTNLSGAPVTLVSEHYAYERPSTFVLLLVTTTADRADVDGRVFGRMIGSLAPLA